MLSSGYNAQGLELQRRSSHDKTVVSEDFPRNCNLTVLNPLKFYFSRWSAIMGDRVWLATGHNGQHCSRWELTPCAGDDGGKISRKNLYGFSSYEWFLLAAIFRQSWPKSTGTQANFSVVLMFPKFLRRKRTFRTFWSPFPLKSMLPRSNAVWLKQRWNRGGGGDWLHRIKGQCYFAIYCSN